MKPATVRVGDRVVIPTNPKLDRVVGVVELLRMYPNRDAVERVLANPPMFRMASLARVSCSGVIPDDLGAVVDQVPSESGRTSIALVRFDDEVQGLGVVPLWCLYAVCELAPAPPGPGRNLDGTARTRELLERETSPQPMPGNAPQPTPAGRRAMDAALFELNRADHALRPALARALADAAIEQVRLRPCPTERVVVSHDVVRWRELLDAYVAWTKAEADFKAAALKAFPDDAGMPPPMPTEHLLDQLEAQRREPGRVIPVDFRRAPQRPLSPMGAETARRLLHPYKPGDRVVAAMDIFYAHTGVEVPEGRGGITSSGSFTLTVGTLDPRGRRETQSGLVLVKWDGIDGVHSTSADAIDPAPPTTNGGGGVQSGRGFASVHALALVLLALALGWAAAACGGSQFLPELFPDAGEGGEGDAGGDVGRPLPDVEAGDASAVERFFNRKNRAKSEIVATDSAQIKWSNGY